MNGIIPLFKPKGYTSHDCVMKIRRLLGIKKVGHTGTLDPNVEGVLAICVGEATKIIPYVLSLQKVYIADVTLGTATTTEDSDGEVVEEVTIRDLPDKEDIDVVLRQFTGEITQVPPMYSAIKVNGKKLYEYARENLPVERPKRQVTIYGLTQIKLDDSLTENPFRIKVRCSKGTYIRTLCVDIGRKLGYPSHMSYLQRIESDSIQLSETVTFDELAVAVEKNVIADYLLPIDRVLQHLEQWHVSEEEAKAVMQGKKFPSNEMLDRTGPFLVMYNKTVLAIYEHHKTNKDQIKPVRVFNIHKM